MLRDYLGKLMVNVAYVAYKKTYGIQDEPFKQSEVYLSVSDNDWNSVALYSTGSVVSIALRGDDHVHITTENNQWNKSAISLQEKQQNVFSDGKSQCKEIHR